MPKTSSIESAEPKKGVVGVDDGSKEEYNNKAESIDNHEVGGNDVKGEVKKSQKMSKPKKTVGSLNFLTPGA